MRFQVHAAAITAALVSAASADVPFQQLADLGFGGSPFDVNAAGVIVGSVGVNGSVGPSIPVIWQTPTSAPTPLPTVNGGYAVAINSTGDIVGTEFQPAGIYGIPILWSNGERFQLPDLGEGAYANDINESGVIIGSVISKGKYLPARWVNRQLEVLPLPAFDTPDGVVWGLANGINSSGVVTGTVRGVAGSGTPSAALRWDDQAVSLVPSEGDETKGVAIDNLGNVLINGYFGAASVRGPALVAPDGSVDVFPIPADVFGGASALTMSRNGIVAGYYFADVNGSFGIKGVAWVNGTFTPLAMPAGQRYAFPSGVGSNGLVFGSATDGVTGNSVPGFWALGAGSGSIQVPPASGVPGQTVQIAAISRCDGEANVGHSVAMRKDGVVVARAVTDAEGKATFAYAIPSGFQDPQIQFGFTDENGSAALGVVSVVPGCAPADLNCDGAVNGGDLAIVLGQWGGRGPADLNADGQVNGMDIALLLSAWGG